MEPPRVELDLKTNRIVLKVDYYAGLPDRCKSVGGYKWDDDNKVWTYPCRMQTCHALRRAFGVSLEIGPILTGWARKNNVLYSRQRKLATQSDSPLEEVKRSHPALWNAMSNRSYQRSGAEFLAMTGHAADFSEPGLGKTITSLAALIQAKVWTGRHLVVVSNKTAIKSTWAEEIKKWAPDAKAYPMPDGWRAREKMLDAFWADEEGARFLIMLPHMLQIKQGHWCGKCEVWQEESQGKRAVTEIPPEHYGDNHKWKLADMKLDWPELFYEEDGKTSFEWDSIIADECHDYLLKVRPGQAKNIPQWAVGMKRLRIRQGGVKLPMTGTPMRGKEHNIFGILHWLDPVRFSSFWAWVGTYFEVEVDKFNHQTVGRLRLEMEEAFYDVIDSLCLRRTKREVRKELPPIMPQEHWVEMEGEHKRQYEQFEELDIAELEDGVVEGLGTLSTLTRLRQLSFGPHNIKVDHRPVRLRDCADEEEFERRLAAGETIEERTMIPIARESPKVQLVLDMLRERGVGDSDYRLNPEGDPKFIIASQFVRTLEGIAELLTERKIPFDILTGKVTAARRSQLVKQFQSPGGPRILLLNTKAGGASLTLDKFCDEMFVMDETWIHDDQVQLMGRIDNRTGEIRPRFVHYIRTKGTVEEGIALNNDDQNTIQHQILDSRRGNLVALSLLRRGA